MTSIYTTERIASIVRTKLGDEVTPYLVDDATIINALDVAQKEFAERTLCLRDTELYTIDIVADQPWYKLPERIYKLRTSWLQGARKEVHPITRNEASQGGVVKDYGFQGRSDSWWRTSTGIPESMITDLREGYIYLAPIPTATDVLELSAYNYPKTLDEDMLVQLEIPDRWRRELVYCALARIYEIEDTELYNQQSANDNLMKWERAMHKAEGVMLKKNRGATMTRFNRNGVW